MVDLVVLAVAFHPETSTGRAASPTSALHWADLLGTDSAFRAASAVVVAVPGADARVQGTDASVQDPADQSEDLPSWKPYSGKPDETGRKVIRTDTGTKKPSCRAWIRAEDREVEAVRASPLWVLRLRMPLYCVPDSIPVPFHAPFLCADPHAGADRVLWNDFPPMEGAALGWKRCCWPSSPCPSVGVKAAASWASIADFAAAVYSAPEEGILWFR